jgi:hypothetical protein
MVTTTFMALPPFLRKNGYKNPTDPRDCPWKIAYDTNEHPFQWLASHPEMMGYALKWMPVQRADLPIWLDTFPFEQELGQNTTAETPLFVDIGGSSGHQCIGLKERFPNLQGRVILQDTADVIPHVTPPLGIEPMVHDFFTPQPIKGAPPDLFEVTRC